MRQRLIERIFNSVHRGVSFGFAIVLFTLFSAWVAAGYAYTFIYATIEFTSSEAVYMVKVLGIGLVAATVVHALHFGLLHRLGLSGFSRSIRLLNGKLEDVRDLDDENELEHIIDALYSITRQNFLFSSVYSFLFVITAFALYMQFSQKVMDSILMLVSGLAACLIYGYFTFVISEYLTGPLRVRLEFDLYEKTGLWKNKYFFSIRIKTIFVILLVLLSMVLLVITITRTHDTFRMALFIGESVFTIGIIIAILGSMLTLSLRRINHATANLADGQKGFFLPYFTSREIIDFSHLYNIAAREIFELRTELQQKVEERTEELRAALEEMEAVNENLLNTNNALENARRQADLDMKIAANLQMALFPLRAPRVKGWDIAFTFMPKSGVSGDLFDFYSDGEQLRGVILFDVSGHGIASGLITMIARTVIRRHFNQGWDKGLSTVLRNINADLIEEIGSSDFYLTGLILRFKEDMVEYVNASHPDIYIKKGNAVQRINPAGESVDFKSFFLGCHDMASEAKVVKFKYKKGCTLIITTDCIYESKNASGEQYNDSRLEKSLRDAPDGKSKEILEYLLRNFQDFTRSSELDDDLTVIVMKQE